MFASFAALFVILAFSIFLVVLFKAELIQVIINIPILWITILRAQAHIKKEDRALYYWIALALTTILFLVLPIAENSLKIYLWWPTLFILILFVVGHLSVLIHKLIEKPKEG